GFPDAVGLRRGPQAAARRLHNPDAVAGDRTAPRSPDAAPRRPLVPVRHASPALGAAPRGAALPRAVRRDVAALHPQPRGAEALERLDEAGAPVADSLADAGAPEDAAPDAGRGLPARVRRGAPGDGGRRRGVSRARARRSPRRDP